jgi:hypothetical protein
VAERFNNGFSRLHWGYHDLSVASADMLALWAAFTDKSIRVTLAGNESPDLGDWEVQYIPDGGFTAALDGNESTDTLAAQAMFRFVFDATWSSTELADSLAISAEFDWSAAVDPIRTQTYYALDIDDGILPAVRVPISSWQATLRLDVSSYVQAVIPAADTWAEQIAARPTAEMIIWRGARFDNGTVYESEMARAGIQTLQRDQGPTNDTITISGYARLFSSDTPPTDSITATRQLTAIRSISSGTNYRVRCGVDWYLKPGATAVIDDSRQFVAGWINYYANTSDQWMEVGSG